MNRLYIFFSLAIVWVFFLFLPSKALALAKFSTSYHVYYQVEEAGQTKVKFVINQKNNLSVVYATDFGLSINETKVENIKVLDEGTPVIPDVVKSLNQTSISFPFVNKIVGKDKIHTFSIEYTTTDITTKHGNTWQIDIPRLEPDENITEHTVILTVPKAFPAPAYMEPKPDIVNGGVYYFSGQKISNKPISAIFGKTQYFRGKLVYHLANPGANKMKTEIALPPDTSYQTVYYEQINPKPENVISDNDGNFLGQYLLNPGETKDVTVDLVIRLEFSPKPTNNQPTASHLSRTAIWNYDHSIFNTPDLKSLNTPKSIYDFVADKLKYDYEKINRDRPVRSPASESLINYQSAICTDYTDVFVSLARKVGIPARELEGYAISDNPGLKPLSLTRDVLHAWPEYFDSKKNTWIQVDPTWSSTTRGIDYFNKLDFNHLVFVIHGENSEYPVPAGGYKNGQKTKDVSFEPIEEMTFPTPKTQVGLISQSGSYLNVNLVNTTGVTDVANISLTSTDCLESSESQINLPPFSQKTIQVSIKKTPFIGTKTCQAIININGLQNPTTLTITSSIPKIAILAGVSSFLAIATFITRRLYLRKRQ